MKKLFLFFGSAICFMAINVYAQNSASSVEKTPSTVQQKAEQTPEERQKELLREQFSNSKIYTPYQIKMMYKAQLQYQAETDSKQKALKLLSETYHYSPEELEEASRKLDETPLFENTLDPKKPDEMAALIQNDPTEALIKISTSGQINAAYIPFDKEDDKPLLNNKGQSETQEAQEPAETAAVSQTNSPLPSAEEILSIQKIYLNPQMQGEAQKRLGYKSYNINPDNFSYETNN